MDPGSPATPFDVTELSDIRSSSDPRDRIALALDFPGAADALCLLDRLGDQCRWVKVGMELFYAEGAPFIERLRGRDLEVFLDLKLHDIPNTVASSVRSLARLDVQLLTVHTLGGAAMLAEAQNATERWNGPKLLGVTILTSFDAAQLHQIGIDTPPEEQVIRLVQLGTSAGLQGFVCSPLEAAPVTRALAETPFLVTPGIRPDRANADDQKRTATVLQAMQNGSSMLVVGRPVTRAADPEAAFQTLLQEIRQAGV